MPSFRTLRGESLGEIGIEHVGPSSESPDPEILAAVRRVRPDDRPAPALPPPVVAKVPEPTDAVLTAILAEASTLRASHERLVALVQDLQTSVVADAQARAKVIEMVDTFMGRRADGKDSEEAQSR